MMSHRPYSISLWEFVSAWKAGDPSKANEFLERFLSATPGVLTKGQLRLFSLVWQLYGSANYWSSLKRKLLMNDPLHILFINDVGFNAGAGIGMARQAQSFLKQGSDVSLICGRDDPNLAKAHVERYSGRIRHRVSVKKLLSDTSRSRSDKAVAIVELARSLAPDVIITGNFHAFAMPGEIVKRLNDSGLPIFVYAHDCDWITGGCAHPLYHDCTMHLDGCVDGSCPKNPATYPPLLDSSVSRNWTERTRMFGDDGVPLVVNSGWSRAMHVERFGPGAWVRLVHLGVDTDVFRPLNKQDCKRRLGVPESNRLVVAGSGFLRTRGKGGLVLEDIFEHYRGRDGVSVGFFGGTSAGDLTGHVHAFGYVRNEEEMATIFSAADVFVNPVTIESFGQTMLEAAACGCPTVSYANCGVTDICVDGITGYHADESDVGDLIDRIDRILGDTKLRDELSQNCLVISRTLFSLSIQGGNWRSLLLDAALKRQWTADRTMQRAGLPDSSGWSLPGPKSRHLATFRLAKRVSVVTVVYNCGAEFHRTAQTILSQSYPNLEWIVIDGGSTSSLTKEILEFYRSWIDIFVSEPDAGIYDAMAKGARLATGLWAIFLGAGDYFAGDSVVGNAVGELGDEFDLIIGNVIEQRVDGSLAKTSVVPVQEKIAALVADNYDGPWMRGLPPHQGTFMRTQLIRAFGFDGSFRISADWDLIFRVASTPGVKVHTTQNVIAYYPNGGFSATNSVAWVEEVKRIAGKYCTSGDKLNAYFDRIILHHRKVSVERARDSDVILAYHNAVRGLAHVG